MAVLEVLTWPDPRLRAIARPVAEIDDRVRALVADMLDTMYDEGGVGLAATQVGVDLRVVVMDVGRRVNEDHEPDPIVMINPTLVVREGTILWKEACLSVPGVSAEVERAEKVVVEALDRDGQPFRLEAGGLLAVCVQHELDHLEGTLYVDRLGVLERKLTLQQYDEARQKAEAEVNA